MLSIKKILMSAILTLSGSIQAKSYNASPEKYIGVHATTDDFLFQELVRTYDLVIYEMLKKRVGSKADFILYNGWIQVMATDYLLKNRPFDCALSPCFEALIKAEIEKALMKGLNSTNPFMYCGVKENTKNFLMYPHSGHYFGFQNTHIQEPIDALNRILKEVEYKFEYDGEYFSFQINKAIFDKLWDSDFSQTMEKEGYEKFIRPVYKPHITLLGTDDIQRLKPFFYERYGQEQGEEVFAKIFTDFAEKLNIELKREENPVTFTELGCTYCECFTPYEFVLVAKLKSEIIVRSVLDFLDVFEAHIGQRPNIIPNDSLHLTVAVKFREPSKDFEPKSLEDVFQQTSFDYAQFWDVFVIPK